MLRIGAEEAGGERAVVVFYPVGEHEPRLVDQEGKERLGCGGAKHHVLKASGQPTPIRRGGRFRRDAEEKRDPVGGPVGSEDPECPRLEERGFGRLRRDPAAREPRLKLRDRAPGLSSPYATWRAPAPEPGSTTMSRPGPARTAPPPGVRSHRIWRVAARKSETRSGSALSSAR